MSRFRRLLVLVCLFALLAILHPVLLPMCAWPLIVDQRDRPVSHVVIVDGDGRHDLAAEFVQQHPGARVLLFQEGWNRLVECGIERPGQVLDREALVARGLDESLIELIPGPQDDFWQAMQRLHAWMDRHPETRPILLSDRFSSRQRRLVADRVLPGHHAQRVAVWGLPNRDYDERNWWRTRPAARSVVYQWLNLAFHGMQRATKPENNE
jgi:hypothetical protein